MKRLILPLAAVAFLATGCAGSPSAEPAATQPSAVSTPTPIVLKQGSYTFESTTGAKGTIAIPGKPDAEVEKLRALAKAKPVTYLTVKVDNREGTAPVNLYQVSIFTPSGEELTYKGASEYISDITPSGAPAETYNQFIHAGNKHNDMAEPLEVKEFVLTGPALPDEFSGVSVYPAGMSDPVNAVPAH